MGVGYGDPTANLTCRHDGPLYPCSSPARAMGYCTMHYQRRKNGTEMDLPYMGRGKCLPKKGV